MGYCLAPVPDRPRLRLVERAPHPQLSMIERTKMDALSKSDDAMQAEIASQQRALDVMRRHAALYVASLQIKGYVLRRQRGTWEYERDETDDTAEESQMAG